MIDDSELVRSFAAAVLNRVRSFPEVGAAFDDEASEERALRAWSAAEDAMIHVDRAFFVPNDYIQARDTYVITPLPIGFNRAGDVTLSSPDIHAFAIFDGNYDVATAHTPFVPQALLDRVITNLFGSERKREIIGTEVNEQLVRLAASNLDEFYRVKPNDSSTFEWSIEQCDFGTYESGSMDFVHVGAMLQPHQLNDAVKLLKPGGVLLTPIAGEEDQRVGSMYLFKKQANGHLDKRMVLNDVCFVPVLDRVEEPEPARGAFTLHTSN
ncbi:MAG: hypothetical protein MHM6MM_003025 [Cercozoa sp. M6MM]